MEAAKKSQNPVEAETIADLFIEQLIAQTGVSEKFMVAARPMIVKAFVDVDPDRRDACLKQVRDIVIRQAETEKINIESMHNAKKLKKLHIDLQSTIAAVKMQIKTLQAAQNNPLPAYAQFSINGQTKILA